MMGNWYGNMFSGMGMLMFIGAVVIHIVLLVAAWRAMKAHESIAESLKDLARQSSNTKP